MNTPYIGVTDFVNRQQVVEAVKCLLPWTDRRIHVGAMVSYKTLNKIPTATGWENIWLDEQGLNNLFVKGRDVFNVIHYADYPDKSNKVHTKFDDLKRAVLRCGPGVEGIQLDMVWPNAKLISELKDTFPDLQIILQVSSLAIEFAANHDLKFNEALETYNEAELDYILLDSGMGRGIAFDPASTVGMINQALFQFPEHKIAIAGGLGPTTYKNFSSIAKKFPKISCDAQGQLRPSGKATDPLDMKRVTDYISGVCSLL